MATSRITTIFRKISALQRDKAHDRLLSSRWFENRRLTTSNDDTSQLLTTDIV